MVLAQTGAAHYTRRFLPANDRWDRYRAHYAVARSAFPDAALAAIPPYPRTRYFYDDRENERRVHEDLRAACRQAGIEIVDLAPLLDPHGDSARCYNRVNLNTFGTQIVGDHMAAWLLERGRINETAKKDLEGPFLRSRG